MALDSKHSKEKSLLAESVETYLRETRNILNKLEWRFDNQLLQVEALHIEQNVITERPKERLRIREDDKERFQSDFSQTPIEITQQAKLYELSQNFSERVQTTWSQVVDKTSFMVIVGAPGSGKSFTTKHTIIKKIVEALDKIERKTCRLEDVEIPIWITATELASQNTDQPAAALEAIIRSSMEKFKLSEEFFRLLRRKLDLVFNQPSGENIYSIDKHIFLVVDSLDELPESLKDNFTKISKNLDKPSLQLIVTCRTLQWDERSGWLGFTPKEKVEVAPLTIFQQKEFSNKFFRGWQDLQSTMQSLLDGNYALSHAFTTPLLLTFGCLLHGDKAITESTTYVEIYELVVEKMFAGVWREEKPFWTSDDVTSDRYLGLLDKICWGLFQKNPDKNLFTLVDWSDSCKKAKNLDEEKEINTDEFLKELVKLGFVVRANSNKKQYSFTHRTFLEFLSARTLKEQSNWLEIARQHFWFAPEWLECLTFTAGLLNVADVKKLIAAVRNEKDDIFGSMIYLEAKFTGASQLTEIEDIERICRTVFYGLESRYSHFNSPNFIGKFTILPTTAKSSHFALNLNKSARDFILNFLIKPLISVLEITDHNEVRHYLSKFLGEIGIKAEEAEKVIKVLINDVKFGDSISAVNSLGNLKVATDEVVKTLIEYLKSAEGFNGIENAAIALGRLGIGTREVVDALIFALFNGHQIHNFRIIQALGDLKFGKEDVVKSLISVFQSDETIQRRILSLEAIGKLGIVTEEVISTLITALQPDAPFVRSAAESIGELGINRVEIVEALIIASQSNDIYTPYSAIKALYKLGVDSREFVNAVVTIEEDFDFGLLFNHEVFNHAIKTLDNLGVENDEFIETLINVVKHHEHNSVRWFFALVLGKLGVRTEKVVNVLINGFQFDELLLGSELFVKALGNLGVGTDEVIDILINTLEINKNTKDIFEINLKSSIITALGKILSRNKIKISRVRRIIKITLLILSEENYYVLDEEFANPLFQISQNYKIQITWFSLPFMKRMRWIMSASLKQAKKEKELDALNFPGNSQNDSP